LDSLVNQTYKDIEILCVNDGSTDDSLGILNEYAAKDSRVKVFTKRNEGKGAASARNLGADNATGKYIQFLDSDDFFEPDMVERLAEKAEATNADVVVYSAKWYDNQKRETAGA
jgi:glycosyltransferase involved in cell wall biosynthesis